MAVFESIPVPFELPRAYPPTMDGGPDGETGRMTFDIAINDLSAFIEYIGGTTETITRPDLSTYEAVIPLQHPDNPRLYVVGYGSQAFGSPGGEIPYDEEDPPNRIGSVYTPMFDRTRVSVDFGNIPFGVAEDTPLYSLSTDHSVDMEVVPFGAFVFPNGYRTTGEYAIRVGVTAYTLTTYQGLEAVPESVENMIGKVNSTNFTIGSRTYPPGTIRLDGVRSEYAKGMYSQTMTKSYALKRREMSWQYALDNLGQWNIPTFMGTGLPKYQTADLNAIKFT